MKKDRQGYAANIRSVLLKKKPFSLRPAMVWPVLRLFWKAAFGWGWDFFLWLAEAEPQSTVLLLGTSRVDYSKYAAEYEGRRSNSPCGIYGFMQVRRTDAVLKITSACRDPC